MEYQFVNEILSSHTPKNIIVGIMFLGDEYETIYNWKNGKT